MVNDLHQHEGNIQSLTNLTLGSRYFGHARVYRYKGKLKIPSLLNFTQFGFAMGPEFSSDIAGDGPRQRIDADGEYDPELQGIQKKKRINASRIEKEKDRKLRDKLIISSSIQKDRKLRDKLIISSRIQKDRKLIDKLIISSRTQKDRKLREKSRTHAGS